MASKLKIYIVRPTRNFLLFCFIQSFLFVYPLLPRKLLLYWHSLLFRPILFFNKGLRKQISDNLEIAFGSEVALNRYHNLDYKLFDCLVKTFTDYIALSRKKSLDQFKKIITIQGENYLKEAHKKGNGVLCLVNHTPGWEFSAIMPPMMGYKTFGVSSKIKIASLNSTMIKLRESRGMININRDNCYERLVNELKNGHCLIIMIDQDSKNIRGDFINFFDKPAYTPLGCARLAMETGAAVVPMNTYRNPDHTYIFKILPEIVFEHKSNQTDTLLHNTQRFNNVIESQILEHPEQWVWMHKRWNTTPETLKIFLEKKKKQKSILSK